MNDAMTAMGYVWTGIFCLTALVLCLDYGRRWWKGRQAKARARQLSGAIPSVPRIAWSTQENPNEWKSDDFPRPMSCEKGWIAESRFTLYAESDAEAIAKLTGEAE